MARRKRLPLRETCLADSSSFSVQTEPLLTAEQAAKILQIHPKTVKRMASKGQIPGMKIGKLWRFRGSALDSWVTLQIESVRHLCPDPETEREQ
jgi:excisionase family DNA binding protein